MKVLLSFAVSLLLTANCFAASPSFGSFYTNHFTTNGLLIRAKLNPTQFDTNASSITITITNVAGVGGLIWTNSLGVIKPTSGQTTNALEYISGSADASTNTLLTLDTVNTWTTQATRLLDLRHQGTNVALWTPYGTVGIGKSADAWWGGFTRDDVLIGVHDSALGESDYTYFYLANVDDALSDTNYADATIELKTSSLSPSAQFNLAAVATNDVSRFNVFMQPDQGVANVRLINRGNEVFRVDDNGSTYFLPEAFTYWGQTDYSIVSVRDLLTDSVRVDNGIAVWTVNGSRNGAIDGYVTTNSAIFSVGTANGAIGSSLLWTASDTDLYLDAQFGNGNPTQFRLHPTIADVDGNEAYRFGTPATKTIAKLGVFENNGTNMLGIGHLGQLEFGPNTGSGATNTLFRNANDLVYTNGGNSVNFEVRKGDAASVKLGLSTGSHGIVLGGSGSDLYFGVNNNGSGDFVMTGSAFSPTSNGLDDLGSVVNQWNNFYLDNSILFGGITNFISRVGDTDVVYEGPAMVGNNVNLGVKRGAVTVNFGQTPAGGAIVQSPSNRAILDVGGAQAFWDGTNFMPDPTGKNLGTAANPWTNLFLAGGGGNGVFIRAGSGDPNGAVTANVGSLFLRLDGGAGSVLYVKEVGTDNMGWAAK